MQLRSERLSISFAAAAVAVTLAIAACGDGSKNGAEPADGGVSRDEAYEMAVRGTQGDPALTEVIPRDTFDVLARTACEDLGAGGSVQRLVDATAQQPTRSGKPLRRESAQAIISASVRGYCPQYSSQLP